MTKVVLYGFRQCLEPALLNDGRLQFPFLSKIAHELHEVQHQRLAMARCDAVGKIGLFLDMLSVRARQQGRAAPSRCRLAAPISYHELSRHHAVRGPARLNELKRRRIISLSNPHCP